MQLHHVDFPFTLLTPCFSGTALGKLDDHAEMRIPPTRGHIRFWHRALFGAADGNRVWGSTDGDEGQGSRVALRLLNGPLCDEDPAALLPHDLKKSGRDRPSLRAGANFTLRLQRFISCSNDDWEHAQRAVKVWLLVGCLGLRSNRAAGSVWPEGEWAPQDPNSLKAALQKLGLGTWSVALIGLGQNKSATELREAASDTMAGNPHQQIFGGIKPKRTPSPTKFKVIRLSGGACLLATAPARQISGQGGVWRTILQEAEHLLNFVKPITKRWAALGTWNYLLP